MIDTDKMRAAYAATPLCQHMWTKKDGNNPTMLCAISALVSFAGVQPDLIHKMNDALPWNGFNGGWVTRLAVPVLRAEYNMPEHIVLNIPSIFDNQANEWRGVTEVLALCERYNMDELHADAVDEDAVRFPQFGPAAPFGVGIALGGNFITLTGMSFDWGVAGGNVVHNDIPVTHLAEKPKGQTDKGKSKFWMAKKPKWLTAGAGV